MDILNRKIIAQNLIKLLFDLDDITPMLINGGWGTGKTFLAKMIAKEIDDKHNEHFLVIYIDAFLEDFFGDPLAMILGHLLKKTEAENEGTRKLFLKNITPMLKFSAKSIGKIALNLLIKTDSEKIDSIFKEGTEILKSQGDELVDEYLEQFLFDQANYSSVIEQVKKILEEFSSGKKIVFLIDELDRCKPDFALALIEKIKHVFDVPNIKFLIFANRIQLISSIKHCYGNGVDADKYFDKFFKFSVLLPNSQILDNKAINCAENYFNHKIDNHERFKSSFLSHRKTEYPDLSSLSNILIENHNLSLREVETFIRFIEVFSLLRSHFFLSSTIRNDDYFILLGVFCFCFKVDFCQKIENDNLTVLEFYSLLAKGEPYINWQRKEGLTLIHTLLGSYVMSKNEDLNVFKLNDPQNIGNHTLAREKYRVSNTSSLEILKDTIRTLQLFEYPSK